MCLEEGEAAVVRKSQALKHEGMRDNLMPRRETHSSGNSASGRILLPGTGPSTPCGRRVYNTWNWATRLLSAEHLLITCHLLPALISPLAKGNDDTTFPHGVKKIELKQRRHYLSLAGCECGTIRESFERTPELPNVGHPTISRKDKSRSLVSRELRSERFRSLHCVTCDFDVPHILLTDREAT
jgi:hypothetical protein